MKLTFHAKTKTYTDILITAQAQRIWEEGQSNIVAALEQTSGLKFLQSTIIVQSGDFKEVHSGWPHQKAMSLPFQFSYKINGEEKLDTLTDLEYIGSVSHELGHHLLLEHNIVAPKGEQHDLEAHQHLYLFLFDTWHLAFGLQQAKELVQYEITYGSDSHIRAARWVRRLSRTKRQELLHYLVKYRQLPKETLLESEGG
jgi:hypothetical protein